MQRFFGSFFCKKERFLLADAYNEKGRDEYPALFSLVGSAH